MKIRHVNVEEAITDTEHQLLGIPPIEYEITHANEQPLMKFASYVVVSLLLALFTYLLHRLFFGGTQSGLTLIEAALHNPIFWSAFFVGLVAQMVDGALGMAYGVTASSFLLALGVPPAAASGATHLAEVFTTGVSGVSHLKLGNVDKKLFLSLLIPGAMGALIGVYILTSVDGELLKPYITVYLLLMGLYVVSKAFRKFVLIQEMKPHQVAPLAVFGGFVDATGGGGWGPVVTSSLIAAGHHPRTTIGSVNFAEFFLTMVTAAAFFGLLDGSVWVIVAGLVIGGLFAAPFAAYATKHFKPKTLLVLVGSLISLVSTYNLYKMLA
jgi:hypothetical protein